MARKRNVGGNEVRAWAKAEGVEVGERGRFSKGLLDQFHAANPKVRYSVGHVPTVQVKGIRDLGNGRKIPAVKSATIPEIRAFAQAQGLPVGARGRISADVKAAFAVSR